MTCRRTGKTISTVSDVADGSDAKVLPSTLLRPTMLECCETLNVSVMAGWDHMGLTVAVEFYNTQIDEMPLNVAYVAFGSL